MKLAGRLKLYLLGPELPIEKLASSVQLIDVQQFIIEDEIPSESIIEKKVCKEQDDPKKIKSGTPIAPRKQSRKEEQINSDAKLFMKFFDESFVKDEASYIGTTELYDAYKEWLKTYPGKQPLRAQVIGKYLKNCRNVRSLSTKVDNRNIHLHIGIALKERSKKSKKIVLGELYRFYKIHLLHSRDSSDKIAVDNLYHLYLTWCEQEKNTPVTGLVFSRVMSLFLPKKSLFYKGTNPVNGCWRRWISGYVLNLRSEAA